MATRKQQFPDRVRFNWGFHDGQHEASQGWQLRNMAQHFDAVYAAGYGHGVEQYRADGKRQESSEPAWEAHTAALEGRRAVRRAQPDSWTVRV